MRIASILLAAGALGAVASCGGTSVLDLEVGQCLGEGSGSDGGISSVAVVDCAAPHQNEVFALPRLPEGAFPGAEAVDVQSQALCVGDIFTTYVGLPAAESTIGDTRLTPTEETWAEGDREVVCLLANPDGSDITGSLRGANR